jgi:hypothetical protein
LGDPNRSPEPDTDRREIREQLHRLLLHPHFRNSRRYPALLRYVVEKALGGEADSLKERTLGVEVFGRTPDYDTNGDHIVRSTAAEVRKRLAQYYQESEHQDEIRIELPSGCYVPQFHRPPLRWPTADEHRPEVVPDVKTASPGRASRRWPVWVIPAASAIFLGFVWVARSGSDASSAALERFWTPIYKSAGTVALCMGDPVRTYAPPDIGSEATPRSIRRLLEKNVPFSDAVTLTRLGAIFSLKGKDYRVVYSRDSTLWDLRQGPAVLVGGVDNYWAVRLTAELRFRLLAERENDTFAIQDSKTGKIWQASEPAPSNQTMVDYALITRVQHATTGHMVVVVGGIQEFGTLAAGEFLTGGPGLAELERLAPKGWKGVNVQALLTTSVMKNAPSPPRIVQAHFW